jgi:LysM repeat protein
VDMQGRALARLRRQLWIERAVFLVVIAAGVAHHYGLLPGGRRACLIAADGHPVTVVASESDARRLLDEVKRAVGPPDQIAFAEKVTLHSVSAGRNPAASDAAAMEALSSRLHPVIPGVAIVADGQVVVGLPSQEEAVRALSLLQQAFAPSGLGVTTVFKENVHLEKRNIAADEMVTSAQAAVEKIRAGLKPKGIHEVKPGETGWKIALDSHVPLSRLAQANPDMDINRIRAGDRVNIPAEGAAITVIARKDVERETGLGPRRSVQVVRVTYENGVAVAREVVGHRRIAAEGGPLRRPRSPRAAGGTEVVR